MYLCDDGHKEVCYDSRDCPVCEKQKELDAAYKKIAELEKQINEQE